MKSFKILFAVALLLATNAYAQKITPAKAGVKYGKAISADNAFAITALQSKMGKSETMSAKVSGKVLEVCTKKGCWMKLENNAGETTRVTFKDYGFFVPADLVGKNVILQGVSKLKTTSVDEQKHYAEDAGKSKPEIAKIITPIKEITFEAEGVLVL